MKSLGNITVAILAGGLGTRLRPVVSNRPKVLADVRGKSFLSYLLDQLADTGARYVVLCTGYLGEQIQATFGDTYGNLNLAYSKEQSPLGTAGALRLALPFFKSDPVLVMNGDSFCEANLEAFCDWHYMQDANATILLTEVSDAKRYGRVNVNSDGLIISFDEKGGKSRPGLINAGIYLLSHRLLMEIPENKAVSLERDVFPAWVGSGLYGYQSEGRFLDIGTPESYADAEDFFALETRR